MALNTLITRNTKVNGIFKHPLLKLASIQAQQFNYSSRFYSSSSFNSNTTNKSKTTPKLSLWARLRSFSTFTASGALIIGATGISAIVIYLIVAELFSPSGDTQIFNRAVTMVEKDVNVRKLLQCDDHDDKLERLKAYGELLTNDKWTRNRPISSTKKLDKNNKAHHFMRFHVESKQKMGLVHVEATEVDSSYQPEFTSMYIDVKGEKRYYLIKPKMKSIVRPRGILGFNWGPRKD